MKEVLYTRRSERDMGRLDHQGRRRVRARIERFVETGHGDVAPLKGAFEGLWRLRVGDWRVIYKPIPEERQIRIERVLPRGKAYEVHEEIDDEELYSLAEVERRLGLTRP